MACCTDGTDGIVSAFAFDQDDDGILDEIDTQPGVYSDVFEDVTGANVYDAFMAVQDDGTTQGTIEDRNGNQVFIDDMPTATIGGSPIPQGVMIGLFDIPPGSSAGEAQFLACPTDPTQLPPGSTVHAITLLGWRFSMPPGARGELRCASLVLAMLEGQVTVQLPGLEVRIPAGAAGTLSEISLGMIQITSGPESTVAITVNGVPLLPGQTTVFEINVAPVAAITGPPLSAVFAVNTPILFTGTFTDANARDAHTAEWQVGEVVLQGTVSESGGSGTVSDTFVFNTAGVYLVSLTVRDNGGLSDTATTVDELIAMVVVYDPEGGFVTGGGWIDSPEGACTADPTLTGRASFGFVSKYLKGAQVPTGQTEFQFRVANLNFRSISYEWLVVSGARAQYKGSGTINGVGDYGFLLIVIDGSLPGGGGLDKFRIKIWDKATSQVVYDNQAGTDDFAVPTTVIGGGSILIHKA